MNLVVDATPRYSRPVKLTVHTETCRHVVGKPTHVVGTRMLGLSWGYKPCARCLPDDYAEYRALEA